MGKAIYGVLPDLSLIKMKNNSFFDFWIETPLLPLKGTLLNEEYLISLEFYFKKEKEKLSSLPPLAKEINYQIQNYFNKKLKKFDVPFIFIKGTPFQQSCWKILTEIPYGETITYQEEAIRIGSPKATRAVGSANGKNPISVIIPCHRVIGKKGDMRGYSTQNGSNIGIKEYLILQEKENSFH